MYDVDATFLVTTSRRFELCRVAFCSAALHPSDRCLLAWLYHPEPGCSRPKATEPRCPVQLETHVVRLSTELRARRLAVRIGDAFQRLYAELEAAQAVTRLQAADERRSRTAAAAAMDDVESDRTTTTTGRTASSSSMFVSDMAAIKYLQYANAAFEEEHADDIDVQTTTFETFRPVPSVVQTTEV